MNRFEQLTAKHLDGVATRNETDELSGLLERNAGAFSEFHAHFEMQELLAALHTPTDEARVDAVLNQLSSEADPFVETVARELRSPRFEQEPTSSWLERLLAWAAPRRITLAVCGATAVTLVACLWGWFLGPVMGEPTLAEVKGTDLFLERATERMAASNGMRMLAKDVLRIGTNSSAALAFGKERTTINLTSGTEFTLTSFASGKRFQLHTGTLRADVSRQRPFHPMIITTPNAEARVLGTEFTLTARTDYTWLDVTEGTVRLADTANPSVEPVKVSAGHYTEVAPGTKLAALPRTGKILREYWLELPGSSLQDLTYHPRYPNAPSGHDYPPNFETDTNWPSAFGTRMRGYLHPPVSGIYEFRISGNGQICLWLSPDEDPRNRVKVGQIVFTQNRPGDPGPETTRARQESGPIPMEAGRRYYVEAAHKYGSGEGVLSVTWKRPHGAEEPIPADFLAPFILKKGAKQ